MSNQVTISGEITFRGGAPQSLAPGSQLKVEFKDVSLACAPSITLGQHIQDVSNYKPGR